MKVRPFILFAFIDLFVRSFVWAACPAPQYPAVYNLTHQSVTMNWSFYGTGSPVYEVQWRPVGNGTWNAGPAVSTSSSSLTGLSNNTDYEWRVRAICAPGDTSAFTSPLSFRTKCDPPTNPVVTTLTHQSARLNWSTYLSGATYEVQWRPVGTTSWTVISDLITTSVTVLKLTNNTTYEWRVRTVCSAAATSEYTASSFFQTSCQPPGNPSTAPINPGAAGLQWNSPTTDARFELQWRPAGTTAWTLIQGLTTPDYALTGLTAGTTYEWQVRTVCSATEKSAFTALQAFQTRCAAPTELNLASTTFNAAVLGWSTLTPADLQWRPAGSATWTTASGVTAPYNLTGLVNNTTYEWRLRTLCATGIASEYTASQLLTTRCVTPMNPSGYANGSGELVLSWYSPSGNSFEVQWRVVGTAAWSSATGVTGMNYLLKGLTPDTNYEWRVRQTCSATETSEFTAAQVARPVCSQPQYTRYESATNASIVLVWNEDASATRYELQWRTAGTTNWTSVPDIAATRYTLTGLAAGASYEWRVRKGCVAGSVSAFTDGPSFSIQCAQPNYTSGRSTSATSVGLNWYGSASYPPYELHYRPVGTVNWTAVSSLTATYYSLTGLTSNTTYEWRVRSACPTGGPTDFAGIQTVQTRCGQPIEFMDARNLTFESAQLSWQSNTSTTRYEIQYRDIDNPAWTVLLPEGAEVDPYYGSTSTYAGKSYTVYRLTPGRSYIWRVRSYCESGVYSDFTDGPMFTISCTVPRDVYGYPVSNTSMNVSWSGSSQPMGYDLQWRALGATGWNTESGLTVTTYALTGLTPGLTYEYRVRQVCASGVSSDFSDVRTTFMPCNDVQGLNASPLTSTAARLTWLSYDNRSAYEIQYRLSGSADWTTVALPRGSGSAGSATGYATTTYLLTGLQSGSAYECRIRAVCAPGVTSNYTSIATVQLSCSPPAPSLIGFGAASAEIAWSSSAAAQSYWLQWRVIGTADWTTVTAGGGGDNTSTYSLTGLSNNTDYEWRVAADCGNDRSDFSARQVFQTSCGAVSYVSTTNIGASQAQVSWYAADLFTGTYTVQYRPLGTVIWAEINGLTTANASLTGLTTNTTYECRVRAVCAPGAVSAFSPISTFRTQCTTAGGVYSSSITTRTVLLNWFSNADNAPVDLQWRPQSASDWTEVPGLTSSTYALTGLTPNTDYIVRIRTVCSSADRTDYSPYPYTFRTIATQPQLTVYVDSLTAQAARLTRMQTSDDPANLPYQLQWRVADRPTWNTTGPLTAASYLLTGLTTNTTYEVRAGRMEPGGVVTYGSSITFTTYCPSLANLSVTGLTAESAQLSWRDDKRPVQLQWRVGGASGWTTVAGVTGGAYSLTGLSNYTIYEWRLQAGCSAEALAAFDYGGSFRTLCQMPFSLQTRAVSTTTAQLYWESPVRGVQFSVRYRPAGAANWMVVSGLTDATYSLTGLTNNTDYEWGVATLCGTLGNTAYNAAPGFTTQCALPVDLAVRSFSGDRALLVWGGAGPTYELQWRALGSSTWSSAAGVTSPYTLTGLVRGTTYEWRVRSTCATASNGPFATGYRFTAQCYFYYYYNERADRITARSAQLSWTPDPLLTYGLRWRIVGSPTWTLVPMAVTSPYTLTGLANNTDYEWQLRTECQPDYASLQTFQTRCIAPAGARTEAATATSAQLRWNDSGEGVGYELQWRKTGSSDWNRIGGIAGSSYTLASLAPGTGYEWQVRSQCSGGSDFRTTLSFSTGSECTYGLYSVRTGSWNDPAVWSCNRVPTAADYVQLKHRITVPDGYVGSARSIRYDVGAKLITNPGGRVRLNP